VLAQQPQLFQVRLEMIECRGAGMPGLRQCYSGITSSQLPRGQTLGFARAHAATLRTLAADQVSTAVAMRELDLGLDSLINCEPE
jgi:hypothetical protein